MGRTTLYGVKKDNTLIELYENNNGMAACFPIWNYLDGKFFPDSMPMAFPCWKLTPETLPLDEYFALLTSFDGYYLEAQNLPEMINLLKQTHMRTENPIKSTRLTIFEEAFKHADIYDKFFITATSVADYSEYINHEYDEELDEFTSEPTLKDTAWNLWKEYTQEVEKFQKK